MKKRFYFLSILILFLFNINNVHAEVPTGEQYSEFSYYKVPLLQILTSSSSVTLYGYDNPGVSPSLSSFLTGATSLVRYEDNTNDVYSNWAIRIYQSSRGAGTYNLSWIVKFQSNENANRFCTRLSNPRPMGGTTNSYTCSASGNTSYLLVNYDLSSPDNGTAYIDFDIGSFEGMSINWFMRLATEVFYPQITPSQSIDLSGLELQNQVIINQNNITNEKLDNLNDTQKETNNKLDDLNDTQKETNNKLDDLNDNITDSDSSEASGEAEDFFSNFNTDTFGLTSVITAPLELIKSITSKTCSPLQGNLPFVNTDVRLPCLSTIYESHFGSFLTIYRTITFGFVSYWVCIKVFNLVKDFKNPEHDEIEVLDL